MRWFVEISSLGKNPPPSTTLCVEAPQWQPALQSARALRGDEGALSNFSIELLDDGYRAIDPAARLKYVVRKAPDDAVLTNGSVAPRRDGDARSKSVRPAADASSQVEAPKKRAGAQTVTYGSTGAAVVSEAPVAIPRPAAEAKAPSKPPVSTNTAASPAATPAREAPRKPPALPAFTVVSTRKDEPTSRSPLTYREEVYAVAEETLEGSARALVIDRLSEIQKSLDAERTGKLVNLAVFDHVFQGRPKRPPLVTLTWKDWKGPEPEVRFPQREGPGNTPTPLAAPISAPPPQNAATAAPSAPPPSAPPVSAPVASVPPYQVAAQMPSARPEPVVAEAARTDDVMAPEPPSVRPPPPPAPPPPEPEPEPAAAAAPAPIEAKAPIDAEEQPVPLVTPRSDPPGRPVSERPAPEALPAERSKSDQPAERPRSDAPRGDSKRRTTPRPGKAKVTRLAGDELLAELFEAFSDLHFLADTMAGAEFVLHLTLEKLPSEVAIVSMFDINKREFVVVRQMGADRSAVMSRLPERSPIAQSAMRTHRAVVVADAKSDERANDERWEAMGVEVKSLVCAPVEVGGRYLGLLELANPLDGGRFTDGDGHALTYIGQQFAEFVAAHGVVTDPDHIGTKGHLR